MRLSSLLPSVSVLLLAAPAATLAADYEPPLTIEQAPEYVPVEVGSGWYLRGDIAYDVDDSFEDADFGLAGVDYDDDDTPFSGSVGFGYHFTDYLRADLNLGYIPGNDVSVGYDDGVTIANGSLSNSAWYAMANAYIDLGTYAGFTPYVGAGIGIYRSDRRVSASYTDPGGTLDFHDDGAQYSVAYALNAGVSYRATPNLSIDLGYQYLTAPDAEYAAVEDLSSYPIHEGVSYHQVRLGLRYDLW